MALEYLTTVSDQMNAEMLVQALHAAGLDAIINPGDVAGYLGMTMHPCRVLVPAEQKTEALAFLQDWNAGTVTG